MTEHPVVRMRKGIDEAVARAIERYWVTIDHGVHHAPASMGTHVEAAMQYLVDRGELTEEHLRDNIEDAVHHPVTGTAYVIKAERLRYHDGDHTLWTDRPNQGR